MIIIVFHAKCSVDVQLKRSNNAFPSCNALRQVHTSSMSIAAHAIELLNRCKNIEDIFLPFNVSNESDKKIISVYANTTNRADRQSAFAICLPTQPANLWKHSSKRLRTDYMLSGHSSSNNDNIIALFQTKLEISSSHINSNINNSIGYYYHTYNRSSCNFIQSIPIDINCLVPIVLIMPRCCVQSQTKRAHSNNNKDHYYHYCHHYYYRISKINYQ